MCNKHASNPCQTASVALTVAPIFKIYCLIHWQYVLSRGVILGQSEFETSTSRCDIILRNNRFIYVLSWLSIVSTSSMSSQSFISPHMFSERWLHSEFLYAFIVAKSHKLWSFCHHSSSQGSTRLVRKARLNLSDVPFQRQWFVAALQWGETHGLHESNAELKCV